MTDQNHISPAVQQALQSGIEAHQRGDLRGAAVQYDAVLAQAPRHPDALNLSGVLLHQAGLSEDGIRRLEAAVKVAPDYADAWCNLGIVLRALGRTGEAVTAVDQALALEPRLPSALNTRGGLAGDAGQLDEAVEWYRRALGVEPNLLEARLNLAGTLADLGRAAEARAEAESVLRVVPDLAAAHAVVGNALLVEDRFAEAAEAFRQAVAGEPGSADHRYSLGLCHEELREWDAAVDCYEEALGLDPDHGPALSGNLNMRKALCRWEGMDDISRRFREGVARGVTGLTPFVFLAEPVPQSEQLACARLWTEWRAPRSPGRPEYLARNQRPESRLTVAYLSANFNQHPTALHVPRLLEVHDRSRFRVLAYCTSPSDGSDARKRIEEGVDTFRDVSGWSARDISRRIVEDEVDLLIDLKGHTLKAVTEVFARRPAPVHVNYMGYPGTTGSSFHDYIVVDDLVVPLSEARNFSESLVMMPDTYWVDDDRRAKACTPPTRAERGLPDDAFVYCCLNNSYKLSPEVFGRWMRILAAVPGSVLWLLDINPGTSHNDNLRRAAAAHGIDPARLVFCPKRPLPEYLSHYLLADLFLDTLPYNAHTTASDALSNGLPVLTCAGETFASRVGASLMRVLGIDELVTWNLDDYERVAVELARDPERLRVLREKVDVAVRTSPMYDTPRYTRHLETAYEEMMRRHRAGVAHGPFRVLPEGGDVEALESR